MTHFSRRRTDGLWHTSNIHAASPVFTRVASYPFRQPERVFFNPYNTSEVWVTSFGNGLMVGNLGGTAPAITTQPASRTVPLGGSVTFTATASGSPAPTFQWQKDNVNIGGASGSSYTIAAVTANDVGTYRVVATNFAGSATSNGAVLTIAKLSCDFNGDGKPDILLENSATGQRVLWLMGGPNSQYVTLGLDLGFLDATWHIVGLADFNGDGRPDILLENSTTGQRVLWLMGGPNNAYVTLGLDLGFLDPAWHIVVLADFNGDGKPDILLENAATGQRVLWLMGGPNSQYVTLGLDLGFLDPTWHIVAATDFSGDGKPDILLENSTTGQRVLWLMGGRTTLTSRSVSTWVSSIRAGTSWRRRTSTGRQTGHPVGEHSQRATGAVADGRAEQRLRHARSRPRFPRSELAHRQLTGRNAAAPARRPPMVNLNLVPAGSRPPTTSQQC